MNRGLPQDNPSSWHAKLAPNRLPHPVLDELDNGNGGDSSVLSMLTYWGKEYGKSVEGTREQALELGQFLRDAAERLVGLSPTAPQTPAGLRDIAAGLRDRFEIHFNPEPDTMKEPPPRPRMEITYVAPDKGIVAAGMAVLCRLHNVLQDRRTALSNDAGLTSMAHTALVVADELDAWATDLDNDWPNYESSARVAGRLRAGIYEPV